MNIIDKINILLYEATWTKGYPDIGGVAGDDDFPTGNILMGVKYSKRTVKTPGGSYRMSIPETKWQWDEFESAKGMEFVGNYHPTLADNKMLKFQYGKRVFSYSRKRQDPEKAMDKINIDRKKEPETGMVGDIEENIINKIDNYLAGE